MRVRTFLFFKFCRHLVSIKIIECFLLLLIVVSLFLPEQGFSATKTMKAEKTIKEWTFLTFLNGHNNLDSYGTLNINDMEKVGSNEKVNVVVQWASSEHKTTRRIYVEKDNLPDVVTSPVIEDLPRVDMGDYKNLIEFVRWAKENYPARHYFINVWNHGGGWHMEGGDHQTKDISWDDFTGNKITTEELGLAMDESSRILGQNVDIYGSDACLMAMIEVASQMRHSVNYFVGSQELEPGSGWPYDKFLARWQENPQATAADIASYLAEEYRNSYQKKGMMPIALPVKFPISTRSQKGITMSVLKLKLLPDLIQQINSFVQYTRALTKPQLLLLSRASKNSQHLCEQDYLDLGDFVGGLRNLPKEEWISGLWEEMKQIQEKLRKVVIANFVSEDMRKATGLSIWLPQYKSDYDRYSSRYENLVFTKESQWDALVKVLIE